jgi:hypothetical protein
MGFENLSAELVSHVLSSLLHSGDLDGPGDLLAVANSRLSCKEFNNAWDFVLQNPNRHGLTNCAARTCFDKAATILIKLGVRDPSSALVQLAVIAAGNDALLAR